MTRFGQIISADVLEDALTTYLKKWIPTYLGEVAESMGLPRNVFPRPKYWTTTPILTNETVGQVRYPAVLIVSPGLAGQPVRRGDGSYEATYQAGVCLVVSTKNELGASRTARRYGAAVRTAVMQRPGLETDYIEGVAWADERFTDFLNAEQETVASATEIFNFTLAGVMNALHGPGPQYPDPLPEPATSPNAVYEAITTTRDPNTGTPYSPVPSTVTRLD
jgi:hypothetical protein